MPEVEPAEGPDDSRETGEAGDHDAAGDGAGDGATGRFDATAAASSSVTKALDEAAKDAVSTPAMRRALANAVRQQSQGVLGSFGPDRLSSSVNKALDEAAKDAVSTPAMRRALANAVRQQSQGVLGSFGPDRLSSSVRSALDNAATDAAGTPEMRSAIQAALREYALSPEGRSGTGVDPAVLLALAKNELGVADREDAETEPPPKDEILASSGLHSADFEHPGSFFGTHEVVIDSFDALSRELAVLSRVHPNLTLSWRGQRRADWPLHNSLYRKLAELKRARALAEAEGTDPGWHVFPTEDEMLAAEYRLMDEAAEWRMSDISALELMARLQHQGGPTRMLDVTRNPLIAAWFAVENGADDGLDARLFAIAMPAAGEEEAEPTVFREVLTSQRYPFWTYETQSERLSAAWGTGTRRRLWVPPAYDARIAAQNAAFLLEGVPSATARTLELLKWGDAREWNAVDVAASTSVLGRPANPHESEPAEDKNELAPIFSYRITADAKVGILNALTKTYGYTSALIYPDIQGLSARLKDHDWLGD